MAIVPISSMGERERRIRELPRMDFSCFFSHSPFGISHQRLAVIQVSSFPVRGM